MSAINFIENHLETSDIMKKSLVLESHKISDAIATMDRELYLLSYGNNEIESIAEQYPDLNKGDILTGWIAVKDVVTHINNLDQLNLLTLLPKLCELSKNMLLDAYN
jgi:beta-lactamase class D